MICNAHATRSMALARPRPGRYGPRKTSFRHRRKGATRPAETHAERGDERRRDVVATACSYNGPMLLTPFEPAPLATATKSFSDLAPMLIWIGALMAAVIIGVAILLVVRRRMMEEETPADAALGLSLHDLRTMRAEGMIDEEEFERMKRLVVGQAGARADHDLVREIREARRRAEDAGVLRARPGFDLTGEPLPGAGEDRPEGPPKNGQS